MVAFLAYKAVMERTSASGFERWLGFTREKCLGQWSLLKLKHQLMKSLAGEE
jgi:hypothetical protein